MTPLFPSERISHYFEALVVSVLQLLLMVVIVIAVADLWIILSKVIFQGGLAELQTVPDLQRGLQRSLAGVLLVLLGLEMMEALRTYFSEHRVKVEVILMLALIAVGRHIIQLDFEHADGMLLIGIAFLVIALALGLALRAVLARLGARSDPEGSRATDDR